MHAQYAFRSKLKQKIAMKFKEKAIRKTEICKKQAQKTNKFQLKQAQKQVTCKSSKKPQLYKKNKHKFAGKPQGWQHWHTVQALSGSNFFPMTEKASCILPPVSQ